MDQKNGNFNISNSMIIKKLSAEEDHVVRLKAPEQFGPCGDMIISAIVSEVKN